MEVKYYWLAFVIILTMIMKVVHDVFMYHIGKNKKLLWVDEDSLNGPEMILKVQKDIIKHRIEGTRKVLSRQIKLRHLFGVLMITVPTLIAPLVFFMPWGQYLLGTFAAGLIYLGFFNNLYNRGIREHPTYLGKTDVVDQLLRRIFKIEQNPDKPAKNKNLVLWIRAILGIFGIAIILSIMSF